MILFGKKRIKKLAIPNILLLLLSIAIFTYSYFRASDTSNIFFYIGCVIVEIALYLRILEQYILKEIGKKVYYVFSGVILLIFALTLIVIF